MSASSRPTSAVVAVSDTPNGSAARDTARRDAASDRILDVREVDSGYGDVTVLDDLSMHLGEEEIVCLVGPNGAGKSTVLKTVFGLLAPWSGSVTFAGDDITGADPADLVRQGMGYVPQIENVFSTMTVEENLRMGGVSRASGLEETIERLYDRFPLLDDKREAKARTLSGGQRQVLAFARALVTEPEVLLIDEPSAGLAPNIVDDVFENVQTVNELGTAILMVEQNAHEGLAISDRGYVLDQGTVRFENDADELLDNPEVGQLYLGG